MTLYLYRVGEARPMLTLENVLSYTDKEVLTADGGIYAPVAADCELSAAPDCSGTLRADWRRENPSAEARIEGLEDLMAELLFGGGV